MEDKLKADIQGEAGTRRRMKGRARNIVLLLWGRECSQATCLRHRYSGNTVLELTEVSPHFYISLLMRIKAPHEVKDNPAATSVQKERNSLSCIPSPPHGHRKSISKCTSSKQISNNFVA